MISIFFSHLITLLSFLDMKAIVYVINALKQKFFLYMRHGTCCDFGTWFPNRLCAKECLWPRNTLKMTCKKNITILAPSIDCSVIICLFQVPFLKKSIFIFFVAIFYFAWFAIKTSKSGAIYQKKKKKKNPLETD